MPLQLEVAPQYVRLVLGSMHSPPQFTRFAPQVVWHEPLEQTVPPVHALPPVQPGCTPQCVLLLVGSMHTPLQSTSPAGQLIVHCPAVHAVPIGHTVPAEPPASPTLQPAVAPQYPLSVWGLTQLPLQSTSPDPQLVEHTPRLQTWPLEHWWPHEPQFVLSVCVFAQYPAPASAPHVV
jgi:hypothetical protein